jgi:hypothetical protein
MMGEEFPSRKLDKFILRLPDGMRDAIAASAKANNRSMNAEIVLRLQNSFSSYDDDDPLPEGLYLLPDYLRDVANKIQRGTVKQTEATKSRRGKRR